MSSLCGGHGDFPIYMFDVVLDPQTVLWVECNEYWPGQAEMAPEGDG